MKIFLVIFLLVVTILLGNTSVSFGDEKPRSLEGMNLSSQGLVLENDESNQLAHPKTPPKAQNIESLSRNKISIPYQVVERDPEYISPFLGWPRFQAEVISYAGLAFYQSAFAGLTLNNGYLVENQGLGFRSQYSIIPKLVAEVAFQQAGGLVNDTSGTIQDTFFNTTNYELNLRYRFYSLDNAGLGFYAGVGGGQANSFRYSYLNSSSVNVVNRPLSFERVKYSLGAEYRSYYQLRGRLDISMYQTLNAASASGSAQVSTTDQVNLVGDLSFYTGFIRSSYLGVGIQYSVFNFNLTSNEYGSVQSGGVSITQLITRIFLGFEL